MYTHTSWFHKTRKCSKRVAYLLIALVLMLAALPDQAVVLADETENAKAAFLEDIEQRTRTNLATIQSTLADRLEQDEPTSSEVWRTRCIRLSMWGPFASFSRWTLETLGDSARARSAFSFLMPAVRWMSEPYLFPVETSGTAEELAHDLDKIHSLMTRLRKEGVTLTLDNVGDASLTPAAAQTYWDYYTALIGDFTSQDRGPELYMSLKLSALARDLDQALAPGEAGQGKRDEIVARLTSLLQAASIASEKDIFLRIDMEEYAYKDLTLELFRQVVERNLALAAHPDGRLRLGVVIQAYLRDAAEDVDSLCAWARGLGVRVPIRLVKGAYLQHEREMARERDARCPVWNHKPSTDASFETICGYMLLNMDAIRPAFATHNIRSQAHVMALAEAFGVPKDAVEFQVLYGMADPIRKIIVAMGWPVREYVPAGSLARGLKYAGRRFEELSNSDNALARTMRGDFSGVSGEKPRFIGQEDQEDGQAVQQLFVESLRKHIVRR